MDPVRGSRPRSRVTGTAEHCPGVGARRRPGSVLAGPPGSTRHRLGSLTCTGRTGPTLVEGRSPAVDRGGEACSYLRNTDEAYDTVFSIWGAVWFTDPEELFPLVAKRLRPGGVFAFSHGETPQHLCGRHPMYGKGPEGKEMTVDCWCYPPEVWADCAHRHGFTTVRALCLPAPSGKGLGTIIVTARLPH